MLNGYDLNNEANQMLYNMDTSKWWYRNRMGDIFMNIANQGSQMVQKAQQEKAAKKASKKKGGFLGLGGAAAGMGIGAALALPGIGVGVAGLTPAMGAMAGGAVGGMLGSAGDLAMQ